MDEKIFSWLPEGLLSCMEKIEVFPRTILLEEGHVADRLYFIERGCLRLFFYQDGKDVTFQFFFEDECVASFDSLYFRRPSLFSLQSIEKSVIRAISRDEFFRLIYADDRVRRFYEDKLVERFGAYQQLFLSRIKDTPRQRYEELIRVKPEIIRRVPLHYVATYLGITPVSLSRIRGRD